MGFPVPEQLIKNKVKNRRDIQDKNMEQPFYPDPIYRPPPRPWDNLRPNHPECEKLSLKKPHLIKRELFQKCFKDPTNLIFKNLKI